MDDLAPVSTSNPPIADSTSSKQRIPVRMENWQIGCCQRLAVGDPWTGILMVGGEPMKLDRDGVLPEDERWLIEGDDTAFVVGNVERVLEQDKKRRTVLVRSAGLRIVVAGGPKRGGVAVVGQLFQDAHPMYLGSDADHEACLNRGVIRRLEEVEEISRRIVGPSFIKTAEGAHRERATTDEIQNSDGWVARFEVELNQSPQ